MDTMQARRAVWLGHVQAWHDSGLTQVAYCRQHDLKPKALAYWIRRSRQVQHDDTLPLIPLHRSATSGTAGTVHRHAVLAASQWLATEPARLSRAGLAGPGTAGAGRMLTISRARLVLELVDMRLASRRWGVRPATA